MQFGDWVEFRRLCEIRCLSPNCPPMTVAAGAPTVHTEEDLGAWLSLARAPGSGPGGRWFESRMVRKLDLLEFALVRYRRPCGSR